MKNPEGGPKWTTSRSHPLLEYNKTTDNKKWVIERRLEKKLNGLIKVEYFATRTKKRKNEGKNLQSSGSEERKRLDT